MRVTHYRRAVSLMEAELGDEVVALDPEGGTCFGFNEVATRIWKRLAEPATFDQLRDELTEEYDVSSEECSADLHAVLEDMRAKGLISIVGSQERQ